MTKDPRCFKPYCGLEGQLCLECQAYGVVLPDHRVPSHSLPSLEDFAAGIHILEGLKGFTIAIRGTGSLQYKLAKVRHDCGWYDPCDEWPGVHFRPAVPLRGTDIWYRGWEVGFDVDAAYWTGDGWRAYKGGCDLDVPTLSAGTYAALLDDIDNEEDEL